MYDIIFIGYADPYADEKFVRLSERFPLAKRVIITDNIRTAFDQAIKKSFTQMCWIVWYDLDVLNTFNFDYKVPEWDQKFIHVFRNGSYYDGICLVPKAHKLTNREITNRFFINKKEVDVVASTTQPYEVFYIDDYASYLQAIETSSTDRFWIVWNNIVVDPAFDFTYRTPAYDTSTYVFRNGEYYDGVCLFSKKVKVSQREFEYRFFVNKKEVEIQASTPKPYDIFYINTYDEYLKSANESISDMFWVVYNDLIIDPNFKFDHQVLSHNKNITHVFKNGDYYDGVCLFSKNKLVSKREFENRFFVNKKEVEIQASTPRPFDIVFISYQEPNAEENWESLKQMYPMALRVHGVKGIHQAHIEAALLSSTEMFWVVDGDAVIADTFNFDYQIASWDMDCVHVWSSINPVNGLQYGYGGVKLLPKQLTLKVDIHSTDMTTNISQKFKSMQEVSNITAFNTDAFTTWRSAFRECCKLTINNNTESQKRLSVWCTLNDSVKYGFYAYLGALAGRAYGEKNASNKEALSKINDFTWLEALWLTEKSQLSLEHMR